MRSRGDIEKQNTKPFMDNSSSRRITENPTNRSIIKKIIGSCTIETKRQNSQITKLRRTRDCVIYTERRKQRFRKGLGIDRKAIKGNVGSTTTTGKYNHLLLTDEKYQIVHNDFKQDKSKPGNLGKPNESETLCMEGVKILKYLSISPAEIREKAPEFYAKTKLIAKKIKMIAKANRGCRQ